jgi:molecular chaperone GrpE
VTAETPARPAGDLDEQSRLVEDGVRALMKDLADARFRLEEESRKSLETSRSLLLRMLEVLDAFDRVFGNVETKPEQITPQMKIWLGNFRSVRRLLEKKIGEEGVVRMENVEDGFDPRWHTVSETTSDPSRAEGDIVHTTRPGYFWKEQILRKAEVAVVKNID